MVICSQAGTEFEDRLQNSLTHFTEIKILYSFYLNNKNEGTKRNMYPYKTATEIARTGFSRKTSSDRSIDLCVLREARPKQLFFGIIMRHNNVTENDDANP